MHHLYSYLIAGLLCAAWNDITIAADITEKHFNDKGWLFKFTARASIACIITIGWLPLLIYIMFVMKDYKG